ncbi:SMI1/KNR4 family protein [Spirobacillus cienkowskii]|uniref:SMI1/KNR4 family protein n=1 Tax=Spirobacillus cienkowskii TaxID=495820 RepID=UPI0030CF51D5
MQNITEFENKYSLKLPVHYKNLLKEHHYLKVRVHYTTNVQEVINNDDKEDYVGYLVTFTPHVEDMYAMEYEIKHNSDVFFNNKLIPFAKDRKGNYNCLSYLNGLRDSEPSVVYVKLGAIEDKKIIEKIDYVANSFECILPTLTEKLPEIDVYGTSSTVKVNVSNEKKQLFKENPYSQFGEYLNKNYYTNKYFEIKNKKGDSFLNYLEKINPKRYQNLMQTINNSLREEEMHFLKEFKQEASTPAFTQFSKCVVKGLNPEEYIFRGLTLKNMPSTRTEHEILTDIAQVLYNTAPDDFIKIVFNGALAPTGRNAKYLFDAFDAEDKMKIYDIDELSFVNLTMLFSELRQYLTDQYERPLRELRIYYYIDKAKIEKQYFYYYQMYDDH